MAQRSSSHLRIKESKDRDQRVQTFQNLQEYWKNQQQRSHICGNNYYGRWLTVGTRCQSNVQAAYLYLLGNGDPVNGELGHGKEHIYESIYDSRWRLLKQEATRLQRENSGWSPISTTTRSSPHLRNGSGIWSTDASSSRESFLDPTSFSRRLSLFGKRSPRHIVLRRASSKEDGRTSVGFGFTLRHFIIYPPEDGGSLPSSTTSQEAPNNWDVSGLKKPVDTIFVKSVKHGSAAHDSGLRIGDRIIAVNGETTNGKSYAEVVLLIKVSRDTITLSVVSKNDDILQMYFSEIARNPESNQQQTFDVWDCASSGEVKNRDGIERQSYDNEDTVRMSSGPSQVLQTELLHPHHHVYAVPARIRAASSDDSGQRSIGSLVSLQSEQSNPLDSKSSQHALKQYDDNFVSNSILRQTSPIGDIARIRKECELKEQFLSQTQVGCQVRDGQTVSTAGQFPTLTCSPLHYTSLDTVQLPIHLKNATRGALPSPLPQEGFHVGRFGIGQHCSDVHEHGCGRSDATAAEENNFSSSMDTAGSKQFAATNGVQDEPGGYGQFAGNFGIRCLHPNQRCVSITSDSPQPSSLPLGLNRCSAYQKHYYNEDSTHNHFGYMGQQAESVPSRRHKKAVRGIGDEVERNLRRISYLRATKEDRGGGGGLAQLASSDDDSDLVKVDELIGHLSEGDAVGLPGVRHKSSSDGRRPTAQSIQRIRALFGDKIDQQQHPNQLESAGGSSRNQSASGTPKTSLTAGSVLGAEAHVGEAVYFPPRTLQAAAAAVNASDSCLAFPKGTKEGWLHCKILSVDGKKSLDRSWKLYHVALKRNSLFLCRDKRSDPVMTNAATSVCDEIRLDPVSKTVVEIADDYTKRKFVFRIKTSTGSECLFQAENSVVLLTWIQTIDDCLRVMPTTSASDGADKAATRKLTLSRNRSPTGQSPATKSRKGSTDPGSATLSSSSLAKDKDSSAKKTWKGKVARQWKKIQGNHPSQHPSYLEGGSIGVPLEECPMFSDQDLDNRVPYLVKVCTSIVEERGLEIVGIYRVPGNNAAVTYMTELVNRPNSIDDWSKLDDPRWNDVNVVSSLLKSFFRKLPDPLFTLDLYHVFIDAAKIEDAGVRLGALKRLVRHHLPECHLETLKLLSSHLCKVAEKAETNKMEIRNLAIVFGPTLVRTSDDNMLSMVTDMSHQCRIVESILTNNDWFFNSEDVGFRDGSCSDVEIDAVINGLTGSGCLNGGARGVDDLNVSNTLANQHLLLHNLQKLEDAGKMSHAMAPSPSKDVSAKDIVSGIISAANRKMLRAATAKGAGAKKDSVDSQENRTRASAEVPPPAGSDGKVPSNDSSRRNSESLFHNAMAIAATVPQLVASGAHKLSPKTTTIISEASNTPKFPIETYQGMEEDTAGRVKQFEEETKMMLMRSIRKHQLSNSASDFQMDLWGTDLAGGILLQEPYQTGAYHDGQNSSVQAPDRFLNMTYLSPSLVSNAAFAAEATAPFSREVSLHTMPTLDPQDAYAAAMMEDGQFDTQKIASHGTLKRMRLQRCVVDGTNSVDPNGHPRLRPGLSPTFEPADRYGNKNDNLLSNLTSTFDEKLRLLLDPDYQSGNNSDFKSKKWSLTAPMRQSKDEQGFAKIKQRSRSLGVQMVHDSHQTLVNSDKRKAIDLKRGKLVDKTKEPPFLRSGSSHTIGLKSNNSLSKSEKQELNCLRKESEEKLLKLVVAGDMLGVAKSMSGNKRKVRRRHTVGGTKDFAQWEAMLCNDVENDKNFENNCPSAAKQSAYASEGINNCTVDDAAEIAALSAASRILERKRDGVAPTAVRPKSSLTSASSRETLSGRRLSLPGSATGNESTGGGSVEVEKRTKIKSFPPLLESQV